MRLRLLAPLLLLLAAAPAPKQAHPALWKLSDKDTTIWLFGTIHALPPGVQWRDPAIVAAMEQADALTLETVIDDNPLTIGAVIAKIGLAPGLPPVAERIPADRRARLEALAKTGGFSVQALDGMKSWTAAMFLTAGAMREIGIGAEEGVERQLSAYFRERKEPIDGLETVEQQLGFFDQLPEAAQRAFLVATLDDPIKARAEFDEMIAAWSKGDTAAIARAFADDPEFTPELRDLLVKRRNAAWAAELQARMAKPGTSFVAVGAGHLAGRDSLIGMLKARGLKVKRAK